MIEKKIHYIWFGGEKPEKIKKCIESWYKYLPDYKIIEWNEKNVNIEELKKENSFFKLCYERKIWGVMTDYLRAKILYNEGGIYLDTDVEVIKRFDSLLDNNFFLGHESEKDICYAVIGSVPKHSFLKKMLEFYQKEIWRTEYYISTNIISYILEKYYSEKKILEEKMKIYPIEYFYSYRLGTVFDKKCITKNSYTIHWWANSWSQNPNIFYLKYKHLPDGVRQIALYRKLLSFYLRKIIKRVV